MRWFPPDPVSPAAKRASLAAADQSHAATAAAAKGRIFSEAVIPCVRAVTQRRRFAAGRIRSASDVCVVLGRALILPRQRSGKRVRSDPPSTHCLPDRDSALVRNGRACAATVYGFRFQSSRDKPRSPGVSTGRSTCAAQRPADVRLAGTVHLLQKQSVATFGCSRHEPSQRSTERR